MSLSLPNLNLNLDLGPVLGPALTSARPYAVPALAALGATVLAKNTLSFLSSLYFYFLRPSTVRKYLHGPDPYALVTGATDGIGKAVAQELYDRGFNLLLHGRSEDKLRRVAEDIRKRRGGDVTYFLADASEGGHDFEQLLAPHKDLNITVVFHNVGGGDVGERIDTIDESNLLSTIRLNTVFPLLLTRALLPRLRASAVHGPVEVQFVGSILGDATGPGLATYGASKAFLKALSRGLNSDERAWGAPSGVHYSYITVGSVTTNSNRSDVNAISPAASDFGKAVVQQLGSGYRVYTPWVWHAVQATGMTSLLSERSVDNFLIKMMVGIKAKAEKK